MPQLTHKEFLARLKKKNKNARAVSEYQYTTTKMEFECLRDYSHPNWLALPRAVLRGTGCPKCGRISTDSQKRKTPEQFVREAIAVHGKTYDYSSVRYSNGHARVTIICKQHGSFEQIPNNHLKGSGCPKCAWTSTASKQRKSFRQFVREARIVHGGTYGYRKVRYVGALSPVTIICKIHGCFDQTPSHHLQGKGCPKCSGSHGENAIGSFLSELDIPFETQKTFETCVNPKTGRMLLFDYYIPDFSLLIERNGEQHYQEIRRSSKWTTHQTKSALRKTQERDTIKQHWARENGYMLLTLPYWDEDFENTIIDHLQRVLVIALKMRDIDHRRTNLFVL